MQTRIFGSLLAFGWLGGLLLAAMGVIPVVAGIVIGVGVPFVGMILATLWLPEKEEKDWNEY